MCFTGSLAYSDQGIRNSLDRISFRAFNIIMHASIDSSRRTSKSGWSLEAQKAEREHETSTGIKDEMPQNVHLSQNCALLTNPRLVPGGALSEPSQNASPSHRRQPSIALPCARQTDPVCRSSYSESQVTAYRAMCGEGTIDGRQPGSRVRV